MAIVAVFASAPPITAQGIHRQDFESKQTHLQLMLAETDAQAKIEQHELSAVDPHNGAQSERIAVRTLAGGTALVGYSIPKTLLAEELTLTAWVRSNRPGVKIAARVVLPRDNDPKTGRPTVLLLEGETSTVANRWDPIKASNLKEILVRQQGYLQALRKGSVDVRDAYADQLVLNVHTGIGVSDVSVDDVEVGPLVPVSQNKISSSPSEIPANLADVRMEQPAIRDQSDQRRVYVDKGKIRMGGRGLFIRGVRRSTGPASAPMARLAEAQFNTVFSPAPIEREAVEEAENAGLRLVPMLQMVEGGMRGGVHASASELDVRERERWLAWHVGYNLDGASVDSVRKTVAEIRSRDVAQGRPVLGHVVEGFRPLSRELDLILVQRYPLMGSVSLDSYGKWLAERRHFARGLSAMVGAVQVHPPLEVARATFGHGPEEDFSAPVGPQPIQMELLACQILAAGYKGLMFSTDWAMSEVAAGRDRMLQAAILNEKLKLMETFLAEGSAPEPCRTNNPNVKAVLFPHERGLLVLAFWNGPNAQYCVGQAVARDVEIRAHGVPDGAQAHLIGPARAQSVQTKYGLGGASVTLKEVDGLAIVLLTTEAGLIAHYQERVQAVGKRIAPHYVELAGASLLKANEIVARLQGLWKSERDLYIARQYLDVKGKEHYDKARAALATKDYDLAVKESNFTLRCVRFVEEMLWSKAIAALPTPVADPFAVSFYTLPEHLKFQTELKNIKFGDNLLETGDFEREGGLDSVGWQYIPFTTDGLQANAMLVGEAREGRRALELSATTTSKGMQTDLQAPAVAEHTRVMMISPPVTVRPGQVAKISGFIRLPKGCSGSVDGAMVYDTVGGEALALRFHQAREWTPFTFYRPIRENARLRVKLVMTGMGNAQFDDLRVEVAGADVPIAGKLDPAKAAQTR